MKIRHETLDKNVHERHILFQISKSKAVIWKQIDNDNKRPVACVVVIK